MSLLHDLKVNTMSEHKALEGSVNLLDERIGRTEYVNILKAFYGFYYPFEKILKDKNLDLDMQPRWKLPLLETDLKYFGLGQAEIAKLPHCQDLPSLKNSEEIYGAIYVVEGSTLGGMILTKHFSSKLNLENLNGLSFFKSYGSDTINMWRNFQQFIELRAKYENMNSECVISSAKMTFQKMHHWLVAKI